MTIGFSQSLKDGIIKEWLKGKNRDKIAYENAVSAGTVSNIIKEWRDQIGSLEADELREFSITLRKAGMTSVQCGSGVRVLNILHDLEICEDDIEFLLLVYTSIPKRLVYNRKKLDCILKN